MMMEGRLGERWLGFYRHAILMMNIILILGLFIVSAFVVVCIFLFFLKK